MGDFIWYEVETKNSWGEPQLFRVYHVYLNPKQPTFLGLLIMISLYKSLKFGVKVGLGIRTLRQDLSVRALGLLGWLSAACGLSSGTRI